MGSSGINAGVHGHLSRLLEEVLTSQRKTVA